MNRPLAILLAGLLVGGCASMPSDERVEHDPWEKQNRTVYRFNETLDKVSLKPIATVYQKIIPKPARKGVTNFFKNLSAPRSALNHFLQGKPAHGLQEIARFVFNSTFGIGGLIDVATYAGVEAHFEDFGQTAAVWGVPPGPYVMLPFFGPRTLRDAVLMPVDIVTYPLYHYDVSSVRDPLYVLRLIELRARLFSLEEMLEESKDPYIRIRESFLQNREFNVYDGDPPMDEDEAMYDEFLEEEDY